MLKKKWKQKCLSAFEYLSTTSRTFQEHFDSSVIVLFTKALSLLQKWSFMAVVVELLKGWI